MATSDFTIPTKQCTGCNQVFPATLDYWHKHNDAKYGLDPRCKSCRAKEKRSKRICDGKPVRVERIKDGQKQCSQCETWYPLTSEHFKPVTHHKDGFSSQCRVCIRKVNRDYQHTRRLKPDVIAHEREYDRLRMQNPEMKTRKQLQHREREKRPEVRARRKIYSREYERKPERALSRRTRSVMTRVKRRGAEGKHTKRDIQVQLASQKGLCWWCGKPYEDKFEIDHRIPLSRGGTNWANSICITCFECNRSKHNKLPHEFNGRLL